MKLMTKEIEDKLAKSPIGSTDARGKAAEVIVKYFNPIEWSKTNIRWLKENFGGSQNIIHFRLDIISAILVKLLLVLTKQQRVSIPATTAERL